VDHFEYTPSADEPLKGRTRCKHCGTVRPEYQGATFAGFINALSRWTQRHVRECPSSPENTKPLTP
jgi:ribosomal protein S14